MPSWAGDFIWYLKAVERMKLPPLHPPDSIVSWAELSIVFHPISDQKMYTATYVSVIRRRENGFDMSYQISLGMSGDYGFFTTTRRAIKIFWLCILEALMSSIFIYIQQMYFQGPPDVLHTPGLHNGMTEIGQRNLHVVFHLPPSICGTFLNHPHWSAADVVVIKLQAW